MIDIAGNELSTQVLGGSGLGIAAAFALRYVFRNASRGRVDFAQDRAETAFVERLQARNKELEERADRAYAERNAAYEELGRLRGEVEFLRSHVQRLERQVASMEQRIEGFRPKG